MIPSHTASQAARVLNDPPASVLHPLPGTHSNSVTTGGGGGGGGTIQLAIQFANVKNRPEVPVTELQVNVVISQLKDVIVVGGGGGGVTEHAA